MALQGVANAEVAVSGGYQCSCRRCWRGRHCDRCNRSHQFDATYLNLHSPGDRRQRFIALRFSGPVPRHEACLEHILDVRCGGTQIDCTEVRHVVQVLPHGERGYVCQHRETQFHTTAEAFIHLSHTVLRRWHFAMYMFSASQRRSWSGNLTGRRNTAEGMIAYAASRCAGRELMSRSGILDHLEGLTEALDDLAAELLETREPRSGWARSCLLARPQHDVPIDPLSHEATR